MQIDSASIGSLPALSVLVWLMATSVFTALIRYARLLGMPRLRGAFPMTIESVRRSFERELLRLPNVVSVGLGEKGGRKVIQVGVVRKVPASDLRPDEVIPRSLEGHQVEVVELRSVAAEAEEERREG